MPTVSVVIPTYNRASVVTRAIDSVLSQTYDDFEVVVVDDCSDDDTKGVVEEYDDERIQYIRHDVNRGACAARNTGIEHSDGRYIAFLDSDDEWHPKKLELQIEIFENSPNSVGAIYTGYYKKFGETRELGHVPTKRGDIFQNQLMRDWVNPTSTVIARSECFDDVGGFKTDLPARQDYEVWIRISQNYQFEYIRKPLVTLHADSNIRITDDVESRLKAHKQVLNSIDKYIQALPWYHQRRCYANQYYDMARYLQKNGEFNRSIHLFMRSLIKNPFNWKGFICLFLALLQYDTQSDLFIKVKNILRNKILNSNVFD